MASQFTSEETAAAGAAATSEEQHLRAAAAARGSQPGQAGVKHDAPGIHPFSFHLSTNPRKPNLERKPCTHGDALRRLATCAQRPPPPERRGERLAQKEVESLWRKKEVLQSMRVDVFMGYSENPMPPPMGGRGTGFRRRAAPPGGRTVRPRTDT
jgi:hypothetical protein